MNTNRKERALALERADLYPVTSQDYTKGHTTLEIVAAVVAAGCKIVQLREKKLSKRAYYELARQVREITSGILMICNDHLDVALAVGADGVHLGTDDLPVDQARKLAPELIIGASSHSRPEALACQAAGADYVNIGPIFATKTKEEASLFVGPAAITEISPELDIPFTVMGGIKSDNIGQVLTAGAKIVAVVTAVTQAPDPRLAAGRLREIILAARP
ncbi:MAG: thiamine phosphate synthase [Deltaproteobacteria bacterium]|nr:thiamine phosphate synthase [Deltaproteobacteria bacterium]